MKLYFIVLGSSIATWRGDFSSGNTLADGWSEPFLQKAGLSMPRTVAASQTRPFLSNMRVVVVGLAVPELLLAPIGRGRSGLTAAAAWPRSERSGMFGSATGILKNDTLCVFGSRIGMLSVEYSGEP